MGQYIPDEDLLNDLRQVAQKLGRTPLSSEYGKLGKYSVAACSGRFGSWSKTLIEANLPKTTLHRRYWTDTEIDNEISRLEKELGHKPSWREIKNLSSISPDTFSRRRGRYGFYDNTNPELSEWSLDNVSESEGFWISGFVCGEGSFGIASNGHGVSFHITQRSDEIELLYFVAEKMGLQGHIRSIKNDRRRKLGQKVGDEARVTVADRWIIKKRVIPFFERFKLMGRKATEFEIFKNAVNLLCQRDLDNRYRKHFTEEEHELLVGFASALKAIRRDPTAHSLPDQP